jgi:hypothetical protein
MIFEMAYSPERRLARKCGPFGEMMLETAEIRKENPFAMKSEKPHKF